MIDPVHLEAGTYRMRIMLEEPSSSLFGSLASPYILPALVDE